MAKEENSLSNVARVIACGLSSYDEQVVTLACRAVGSLFEHDQNMAKLLEAEDVQMMLVSDCVSAYQFQQRHHTNQSPKILALLSSLFK